MSDKKSGKKSDKKIEVLLHEHSIINKKIDDFISNQFKYITTLISMSVGFIYFAVQDNLDSKLKETIVFLPYLIIIIGSVFLYKFNRVVILHGYRHFIEEKINSFLVEDLIFGGALVKAKLLHKNLFAIINYIILLILFLYTVYKCSHKLLEGSSELTFFYNKHFFLQLFFIIIPIAIFIFKNTKAFDEGYQFAKENNKKRE